MTVRINEVLRPYGLARSQWEVLYRIVNAEGITQKDLQSVMNVESGTLTGIVDSLVKKGWLTRQEHPHDRRIKLLKMNLESQKRWSNIPNPIHLLRPHMMKGISEEEETFAIKLLQNAVMNLNSANLRGDNK
jgi:DNA-binding MarR family transcriptional regulator